MQEHEQTPDKSLLDQQDKGKDISPEAILSDAENKQKELITKSYDLSDQPSQNLRTILSTRDIIMAIKATDINFAAPVLKHGDNPVIYPNTINVIQGQAGVHKSRLAENICSALLKRFDCKNELLGFKRSSYEAIHKVVYVDTERNISEQLPYAMQSIQLKAGYSKTDNPANFDNISLLQISRKDRFKALEEYLKFIRKDSQEPFFIVLDVSTDCIEDFNKTDKSMELIDLMNIAINEHNVIFLCLIHENPGSDKARGHFGTELMNKASTVMQVGFEKDGNGNNTDLIKVKYLKCRSTARHAPFHVRYCAESKGLVLADANEVTAVVDNRKIKASNDDIIEQIELYLGDGTEIRRPDLLKNLCKEFNAAQRTIETRLKEIISRSTELKNADGEPCLLVKTQKQKTVFYMLQPLPKQE